MPTVDAPHEVDVHGVETIDRDAVIDLEVTSLNPLTVALAPMEEEDWGE